MDLARTADARLRGPDAGTWLGRLDREQDNLRAALGFALSAQAPDLALQIAGVLGWVWFRRGYLTEARHWLEQVLEATAAGLGASSLPPASAPHWGNSRPRSGPPTKRATSLVPPASPSWSPRRRRRSA